MKAVKEGKGPLISAIPTPRGRAGLPPLWPLLPQPLRKDQRITIHEHAAKGGWVTFKTLRRINKTQFKNGEHNTQNAIALLNHLKRIAPQLLMLRT
jgi:hypothetical protein